MRKQVILTNPKPKFIDFMFRNNMVIYHNPYVEDLYDPTSYVEDITLRYEFDKINGILKDEGNRYDVYARYKGNEELIGYIQKTDVTYLTNNVYSLLTIGGKAWEIEEKYDEDECEFYTKVKKQIWIPYEIYLDF